MKRSEFGAADVLALLARRHAKDVFVPECKDGPSQGYHHHRLDAWAMRRSWSDPRTFGYEIKLTRGDFLRDAKLTHYATLCSELYLVAPPGVLEAAELPEGVGHLEVIAKGRALRVRSKAPTRRTNPDDLEPLLRYVLMSRASIVASGYHGQATREERLLEWRAWLVQRQDARDLGADLRGKIGGTLRRLHLELETVKAEVERFAGLQAALDALGLAPGATQWDLERKVREAAGNPQRVTALYQVRQTLKTLQALEVSLDAMDAAESKGPDPT